MDTNKKSNSVIDDTVKDLPKLMTMTAKQRAAWWDSLGDLEQVQLSRLAGVLMGVALGGAIKNHLGKWTDERRRPG
jgi:hypothetical protein